MLSDLSTRLLVGILLSSLGPLLTAGCDRGYDVETESVPLRVGDDTVAVVVHTAAAPGLTYLSLHDNENTGVETAQAAVRRHGGRLFELSHAGTRNVSFALGGVTYTFDPNRMFTDAGAAATLAAQSRVHPEATEAVRGFARAVIARLGLSEGDLVVTVHNNTEEEYSIRSYMTGGEYAADVRFVHLSAGVDPDDFFFVTDQALYDALRDADVNVAMQDNARAADDGSLSVYCGLNGIRYVNVEAQHGHYEYQLRMLDLLNRTLAESADAVGVAGSTVSRP